MAETSNIASMVLGSILALFVFLAFTRISPVKLFLILASGFYLMGWISLDSFLYSYVNPAVMTLMLLLILSIVFEKTLWSKKLSDQILSPVLSKTYLKMGAIIGLGSSILNNTVVVANFIPKLSENHRHSPNKLLLPLSYIAILGGTLTLIGTSTHLIINGLLQQAGFPPIALLDYLYVGIPILVFGVMTILFIAPMALKGSIEKKPQEKRFFIEAKVSHDSPLIGQTIKQAKLRNLSDLFLVELIRDQQSIVAVSPSMRLQEGDRLLFSGSLTKSFALQQIKGIELPGLDPAIHQHKFVEVIIAPFSHLIGSTLKKSQFRSKFDAAVVAVRRGQEQITGRLGELVLQQGDQLILATGSDFERHQNLSKNFIWVSAFNYHKPLDEWQSLAVLFGFLAVMFSSAMGFTSLFDGLLLLVIAFTLLKWMKFSEIKRRLPIELFLIIGSSLVLADVVLNSGAANILADTILTLFGSYGVWGAFIAVYLLTLIMTETITNNASAALAFPIAIATANMVEANVLPFVFAVAYGASASFLTPYGYQTNLMVYAPGRYQFSDYLRLGMPVSLVYSATVLALTPIFFPF
ncbi:SLC13 family permease [Thiomicrorhabdus indica]|uniref:SLC13 family permease n=1 Tax=Thiomicrorhabdus indica TaxID=2267253 RepID=UPI002AA80886|nr:SLC13 family permease [Thiomicrorhabdus indica]